MKKMHIVALDSCDSTNSYLKNHYEQLKDKLPVLVTSGIQTGGRGRQQRKWVSPRGKGVYSSFGFDLGTRENLSLLPLIAGIGVIKTVKQLSTVELGLKWPNDVLWKKENKKLAGILIENVIMETRLFCITGIGINLNQVKDDFPEELRDKAVSLKMAAGSGNDYPVDTVNRILADVFFQWLGRLERNDRAAIIETANGYAEFLMDRPISFHHSGGMVNGIFKGIHESGGLILGDNDGGTSIHYSGEIA